jgi:hypothetical protein
MKAAEEKLEDIEEHDSPTLESISAKAKVKIKAKHAHKEKAEELYLAHAE